MIDRQEQMFHCSKVLCCLATLLLFRLSEAQSCNAATQNCYVCRTLCNGVTNQINVFQNSSVPRLTCTPSQVGGALGTVRWYHRTSSDDVQGTLIVKDGSRYGGDARDTLSINNVVPGDEGLYRCEYTLTGGTSGQDDDVGCVLVQGRAAFTSCNSQTCSEVITINAGQNITFDTRIMFSNSGPCGIPQGTDSLQLYRGTPPSQSNLLYVCGNANNNPCPETYMTSTIRAVSSGSHKFNLSLTIPNAAVEDGVTYTARVEVLRPSGGRATLQKTFHVTVNTPPPTTPPPSQPTTPPSTTPPPTTPPSSQPTTPSDPTSTIPTQPPSPTGTSSTPIPPPSTRHTSPSIPTTPPMAQTGLETITGVIASVVTIIAVVGICGVVISIVAVYRRRSKCSCACSDLESVKPACTEEHENSPSQPFTVTKRNYYHEKETIMYSHRESALEILDDFVLPDQIVQKNGDEYLKKTINSKHESI